MNDFCKPVNLVSLEKLFTKVSCRSNKILTYSVVPEVKQPLRSLIVVANLKHLDDCGVIMFMFYSIGFSTPKISYVLQKSTVYFHVFFFYIAGQIEHSKEESIRKREHCTKYTFVGLLGNTCLHYSNKIVSEIKLSEIKVPEIYTLKFKKNLI